jgi:hypothetical protein
METPMKESDKKWLRDLNEKSWKRPPHQRWRGGGHTSGYYEDKPISKPDRRKFWKLIERCSDELVFEPGSGVFGFGASMAVYIHTPARYPGLPEEAELLICVTSKQMFDSTHEMVGRAYQEFGKYTHTELNRAARYRAGFQEPLHDWSRYDY